MKTYLNPDPTEWDALLARPVFSTEELEAQVVPVLQQVKAAGDAALREFTQTFDGVALTALAVSEAEFQAAATQVDDSLKEALAMARQNIQRFHRMQVEPVSLIETSPGVTCWRKSVAIPRVGLYIPGGTAPLFSTILMLGVPAQIAGCERIVLCTPPSKDGSVHPVIRYTAQLLGITEVYKVGGAQAVAAMAYGTETVPQVDKIFGPGNQYVTLAKQLVNKEGIAIDMPAGPSEVLVMADAQAQPAFVAADLLSQAEHGVDSQVILVADSETLVKDVLAEVDRQLPLLPRKALAEQALANSRAFVMEDEAAAIALVNRYAPEHLILALDEAERVGEQIVNAGSVFLGNYTPESVGDYASGTNHTLPTNGFARAYSGVSLDSFVKKITFQRLSEEGLKTLGPAVEIMAEAEELRAHRQAVSLRLEALNEQVDE